jgi:hypothetical protein
MTDWKAQELDRAKRLIEAETYEKDGALYWRSVDRPVPVDCFETAGLPIPPRQTEACSEHARAFIEAYRKSMENHVHSEEEMFEMRAAFGEGAEVVNVITGKRIKL